jgi:hypothetical protein
MIAYSEIICLSPFEEAIGVLHELHELDGSYIADIGPIHVWLPEEIATKLKGLQGQRIGVLRTDRDYRFRIVGDLSGTKPKKADLFNRLITDQGHGNQNTDDTISRIEEGI